MKNKSQIPRIVKYFGFWSFINFNRVDFCFFLFFTISVFHIYVSPIYLIELNVQSFVLFAFVCILIIPPVLPVWKLIFPIIYCFSRLHSSFERKLDAECIWFFCFCCCMIWLMNGLKCNTYTYKWYFYGF